MNTTTIPARVRTRIAPPTLIAAPAILDPGANPLPSEAHSDPAPRCANQRRIRIVDQPLTALRPASRQVRRRGKGQIEKLMANIAHYGCVFPALVTGGGEIIDHRAMVEACRRLGWKTIPTIIIDDLSPEEVKALRISLNKLAEGSTWDPVALAADLEELLRIPDLISLTGFTMPEIDLALASFAPDPNAPDPADHVPEVKGQAVSRLGDL
jgi:ParB-like chromosome segregation protein Spo0J